MIIKVRIPFSLLKTQHLIQMLRFLFNLQRTPHNKTAFVLNLFFSLIED